jgi:hypothetical protein
MNPVELIRQRNSVDALEIRDPSSFFPEERLTIRTSLPRGCMAKL